MSRATVLLSFLYMGCGDSDLEEVREVKVLGARVLRPGCASSPYATIQSAIDAASNLDVIRVCAGTYNERLVVAGKALRFVTQSGLPDVTIDAQSAGAGLTVSGGADVAVDGFTFVNGSTADGGGNIHCTASTIAVTNSRTADGFSGKGGGFGATDCTGAVRTTTFEGNTAWRGGGAWAVGGSLVFQGNTFRHNEADGSSGGGLYVEGTSHLIDNTFEENEATINGGAAFTHESFGTILGNTVERNHSADDGGGIYVAFGAPRVEDNTFVENESGDEAGGLRVKESLAVVRDNVFIDNLAWDRGGAMKISHGETEMSGNTFIGNEAPDAGAIYLFESASTLIDDTFVANVAWQSGGAIYIHDGWDPVVLEDCTFTNNEASAHGGHLYIELAGVRTTLRRLVMTGGVAARGGAVSAVDSDVVIENTLFEGNEATISGGALFWDDTTGTMANLVSFGNDAPAGSGLTIVRGRALDVVNAVFASHTGGAAVNVNSGTVPTVRYSDFYLNPSNFLGMPDQTALNGNRASNPRFNDTAAGDFTLRSNSTLIDRGDPAIFDTDGTRSDMGLHGGPEAL